MMTQAEPRYFTRATPGALNSSRAFDIIGKAMRVRWLPWQVQVNRVMTERRDDDPSRYRYTTVVISVPRQSGKTKGIAGELCVRTAGEKDHLAFYTAQKGKDARERHNDIVKAVQSSPLSPFVHHVMRAGAESLVWPNGSEIRAFAPTATSLHGYTPPTVVIDEGWAQSAIAGPELMAAISPAQQTLPNRQKIILSTMGDSSSSWFHGLVEQGRAATEDPNATMAYFEWSADPESDLYDPSTWHSFHPGLDQLRLDGRPMLTHDGVLEMQKDLPNPADYARAFGNVATRVSLSIVPAYDWAELGAKLTPPHSGVVLAYDVAGDRSQASVMAAWRGDDGKPEVATLYSAPGHVWLADKLVELAELVDPIAIGAHDGEPTRDVTTHLRRSRALAKWTHAGLNDDAAGIDALPDRTFATACGAMISGALASSLRHDGSRVLADAMDVAVLRPLGDGVALSRRHSRGPIDALVAMAVAVRLVEHKPTATPKPYIYVAS